VEEREETRGGGEWRRGEVLEKSREDWLGGLSD